MKQILLTALGLLGFAMSLLAQSPIIYEDDQVQVIDSVQVSFEQSGETVLPD